MHATKTKTRTKTRTKMATGTGATAAMLLLLASAAQAQVKTCAANQDCGAGALCVQSICMAPVAATPARATAVAPTAAPVAIAMTVPGTTQATVVAAASPPAGEGAGGLFLALKGGLGYLSTSGSGIEISSMGLGFGLDLGAKVAARAALFATGAYFAAMGSPSISGDGLMGTIGGMSSVFAGVGVRYLGPVLLGGRVGVSQVSLSGSGTNEDTSWGLAGDLDLGHDWPLGSGWGIGLAGHFSLARVSASGAGLTAWQAGLSLSADYQ